MIFASATLLILEVKISNFRCWAILSICLRLRPAFGMVRRVWFSSWAGRFSIAGHSPAGSRHWKRVFLKLTHAVIRQESLKVICPTRGRNKEVYVTMTIDNLGSLTWLKTFKESASSKWQKKNALYLSVNVFSTKALIGTLYFTSPNGDGTVILRGHPSHAKV